MRIAPTYLHPAVPATMLALSRNRRKAFITRRALAQSFYLVEHTRRALTVQAVAYETVAAELLRRLNSGELAP